MLVSAFLFAVLVLAQLSIRGITHLITMPPRSGLYGVFLSNGQVYFGTIAKEDAASLLLKDIYYIETKTGAASTQAPSDVSLIRLGSELHGPENWMEVNREHILFIEKLRPDGKVAKAIDDYGKK